MITTTQEHFEYFKYICKQWLKVFQLGDWDVYWKICLNLILRKMARGRMGKRDLEDKRGYTLQDGIDVLKCVSLHDYKTYADLLSPDPLFFHLQRF